MDGSGELQCVGKLEIAEPKPVGFLCGTLPVPTDSTLRPLPSAIVPSADTTGAPRYQMLPAETDLNTPPAAAKSSEDFHWESGPVSQNLSRKCEALAISGLTEYGGEINVIAPTDILKQIFKIPYSKAQVSIAVQRIGDTLILNTGPDVEEGEKVYRRQSNQSKGSDPSILSNFAMHSVRAEACDCPPTYQTLSEKQSSSTILPGHFGSREGSFVSSSSSHVGKSQFLDHGASGKQKSAQENHDKIFWGTKPNKQKCKKPDFVKKASQVGEKTRRPVQESDKYRSSNGFLRVLFWQFHNFRMLLGSDLLLFSNEKYVSVSLHLWDVARQVTPLTWLEAWLDNVMANAPELAICYHQNGVVQGYELLKTNDIFLLKGISEDGTPAFNPQVVQQNGHSVLRFLQDNCKQDPGAYWLYKSAGEDVLQLFNLSVMPKKAKEHDKSHSSLPSIMHKGRRDSLFSLGTLLYRVAHRLSLSKAPEKRAKCATFFKKCLDFLRDQDHLVVRAYAHEQFARLILKCYEELELTSESFLLESEVTVTELEEESSEFSLGMFGSSASDKGLSQSTEDATLVEDGMISQSSGLEASGTLELEAKPCLPQNTLKFACEEVADIMERTTSSYNDDNLAMPHVTPTSPPVIKTVSDPISSKLAAIHHVSQAIKSLRWTRQLQNTPEDLSIHGNKFNGSSSLNFSLCACGDADCIEVCDIREWLPKSKIDNKMWNLVLLLGESYLALGEAYMEDGQLQRALKVVELACLVYGSMPQHLEDARFISSMVSSPSCQLKFNDNEMTNYMIDGAKSTDSNYFVEANATEQQSPTYLFWAKAWTLVGDVYVEYQRTWGKGIPILAERKTPSSELRMSNEVVREVKRLKKKLGQSKPNCNTCSLINCSCQSDRVCSGNSASSSSVDASLSYGRKQSRKLNKRNSSHLFSQPSQNDYSCTVESGNVSNNAHLQNNNGVHTVSEITDATKESSTGFDNKDKDNIKETDTTGSSAAGTSEPDPFSEDASKVRYGGIFRFLEGPKTGDIEHNLLAAIGCYSSARKAMDGYLICSAECHDVVKKMGWVCNELGRYRLDNGNLSSAEIAFADAKKAFKEVFDHVNIILINCNLGHGRRALAEELVTKMDKLKKLDLLQNAYKHAMKTAKSEYLESLRYYDAAKTELSYVGDNSLLNHEVYTQYAHTYLRLGMLLAGEGIVVEGFGSGPFDEFNSGRPKEQGKHEMSANDAFREALSLYESLGDLRRQEAAFTHFQLACYHRDICLKFLDSDKKPVNLSKYENKRQKAKWYASLAEKNWHKSLEFYGPTTHPVMYLNILSEQSALSFSLSNIFHSSTMSEAALVLLFDGRKIIEENGDYADIVDPDISAKFWNQLQSLLKSMLAASLSGSTNKACGGAQSRAGDAAKLRAIYRMSLKSSHLGQLHAMHRLWLS